MAAFVLVHGSWLGGWVWRKVIPKLRAAHHDVYAATLTGLGERAHLARPEVDLALHIEDIASLIAREELRDMVLVGHSYSGMVVTAIADRMPERVRHLVYVDAVIPENGKSVLDVIPREMAASVRAAVKANDGWRLPPAPPEAMGITDPGDARWVAAHAVGMPIRTHEQPIELSGRYREVKGRTFIYCSSPAIGGLEPAAKIAQGDSTWRYHELKTGHDPMVTMPEQLVRILLQAI
ncbi:MAG: alpha/beta hydrolase [Alphaproteobacteria bacterium]|nr:alpha/beta hydrolase [Alphaproteobacteria bacterium]